MRMFPLYDVSVCRNPIGPGASWHTQGTVWVNPIQVVDVAPGSVFNGAMRTNVTLSTGVLLVSALAPEAIVGLINTAASPAPPRPVGVAGDDSL